MRLGKKVTNNGWWKIYYGKLAGELYLIQGCGGNQSSFGFLSQLSQTP